MNKKDFLEKLTDFFQEEQTCKPEDKLEDYELWDSLAVISLKALLSNEYNINISSDEISKLTTVKNIIDIVFPE